MSKARKGKQGHRGLMDSPARLDSLGHPEKPDPWVRRAIPVMLA